MSYNKVSLKRVSGTPGPKDSNLIFILVKDLAANGYPLRNSGNVKMTGDFVLKADAKAFGCYATPSTIKRGDKSEGDPDTEGWMQNLSFDKPGDELAFNEFTANNITEPLIIISRECAKSSATRVHGTPCNPMRMTVEETDDNTKKAATVTCATVQRSEWKSGHYTGTMPALYDEESEESGSGSGESGV